MICWYCHWGWAKAVRDIYNEVGESAMQYGPGHIVWCDENFDLGNVEYCIRACDEKTDHWKDLPASTIDAVRESLLRLAALPKEVRECEPEAYEGDDVEKWPPKAGLVMTLKSGVEYVSTGKPNQLQLD